MTLSAKAPPEDSSTSRANEFPSLRENPLFEVLTRGITPCLNKENFRIPKTNTE